MNRKLTVQFDNTLITHVDYPKYLGMTLDRRISYKPHLEKSGMKVNSRVKLIRKLTGINWGSRAHTFRTACVELVYFATEYCASVCLKSVHVNKVKLDHRCGQICLTSMAASAEQHCAA
jgi:hypothetical protein